MFFAYPYAFNPPLPPPLRPPSTRTLAKLTPKQPPSLFIAQNTRSVEAFAGAPPSTLARPKPFKAPEFTTELVNGIPVHRFLVQTSPSSLPPSFPPFIVDHADLAGQAQRWIDHQFPESGGFSTPSPSLRPTFLFVVGLAKSGKSAFLENLLPGLVARRLPDAVFWSVDFRALAEAGSDAGTMLTRLLNSGLAFADANGIQVWMHIRFLLMD